MTDSTASLSMQFGVSTKNPMNINSGYLESPYESQEYLDLGDWGAGSFSTQFGSYSNPRCSTQLTVSIDSELGTRSQFIVSPDTSRSIKTQCWFLLFHENKVNTQFFMENPYSTVAEGDYCKVQWPSYAWPYLYVTQVALRTEFIVVPVVSSPLACQFNVSSTKRSNLGGQLFVAPIGTNSLNTSFYAPLALSIDHGRQQLNCQWRFSATPRTHFEVRWRPF